MVTESILSNYHIEIETIAMRGHHISHIINYFQNKNLNAQYRVETIDAFKNSNLFLNASIVSTL